MRKFCILSVIVFIVSLSVLNCSEDEVTSPDNGGNDPTVNIISPSDGESFVEGATITFTGTGEDFEGNVLPDSALIWTSDIDDTIGTGTSFDNDSLSMGDHVITLTGIDTDGRTGSESITIEVTMPEGFVLIPADTFTMGSPADEPSRSSNETQHAVTLTNDYYMSETEITNQQYADMAQWAYDNGHCTATSLSLQDNLDGSMVELLDMGDSDCEISFSGGTFTVDSGKEDHPVLEVSWFGAVSYCDWLSMKAGLTSAYNHSSWECNGHDPYNAEGYHLPTEAEWEYACRAGTQTPFNTGNCLDAGTEANYDGRYPYSGCPSGPYEVWTVPVGSYPANSFGLYDMHGNVLEWCNDWYGSYSGDETDPVGPAFGSSRVLRGGGWGIYAHYCRSALRAGTTPSGTHYSFGFRVCRAVFAR
ncbi:MAG: SUMF1/EgtB/PvdO family nonheme iron enzyme [Candidatus Krumholzibacteriota bacterium]|nr:SUMF1/EgtB/PvdO family nonheme iron enzyme [Candidatus Krumholzibacteriota bacterium]